MIKSGLISEVGNFTSLKNVPNHYIFFQPKIKKVLDCDFVRKDHNKNKFCN